MSAVTVRIPTPLRVLTHGADEVRIAGGTVAECLTALGQRHHGLGERLLDERGELRRFVSVFVGPRDVRMLQGLATRVEDGAVLTIVPDVAGGSCERFGRDRRSGRRR